jgi:hypothetical protein
MDKIIKHVWQYKANIGYFANTIVKYKYAYGVDIFLLQCHLFLSKKNLTCCINLIMLDDHNSTH